MPQTTDTNLNNDPLGISLAGNYSESTEKLENNTMIDNPNVILPDNTNVDVNKLTTFNNNSKKTFDSANVNALPDATNMVIESNHTGSYTFEEEKNSKLGIGNIVKYILLLLMFVSIVAGIYLLYMTLNKSSTNTITTSTSQKTVTSSNVNQSVSSQQTNLSAGVSTTNSVINNQIGTVRIWSMWENSNTFKAVIEDFNSKYPNIKIEYVNKEEDSRLTAINYKQHLFERLGQTGSPDIFLFDTAWISDLRQKNLLSQIPASVLTKQELQDNYFKFFSDNLTTKSGKVYGVPQSFDSIGVYYNLDILKAKGLDKPAANWKDFLTQVESLTTRDSQGRILVGGISSANFLNVDYAFETLNAIILQNTYPANLRLTSDDGRDSKISSYSQTNKALTFWYELSKSTNAWDDKQPRDVQAFAEGKLAMMFGPSWKVDSILKVNPNLKFDIAPLPQVKDARPEEYANYATGWSFGISQTSVNKELAAIVLKHISSSSSLQLLNAQASKVRPIGQIYPRLDMVNLQKDQKYISAYISQGSYANSWVNYKREDILDAFKTVFNGLLSVRGNQLSTQQADVFLRELEGKVDQIIYDSPYSIN